MVNTSSYIRLLNFENFAPSLLLIFWRKTMKLFAKSALAGILLLLAANARAQNSPLPYGPPINLETAKKAAAAALAEARKNNWTMAVSVVDPDGTLVYFEKMDNTQNGSVKVSQDKARSAALFKRPTKAFQDRLAAGGAGLGVLKVDGAIPIEGGVPLVADGKIIGAIGVSGDSPEHDGQCAQAGADVLK
jgi:glc operon protein GlcG